VVRLGGSYRIIGLMNGVDTYARGEKGRNGCRGAHYLPFSSVSWSLPRKAVSRQSNPNVDESA